MSLISGSRSAPTTRPIPPLGSRLFRSLVTRRLQPLTTGRVILHEDGKRVSLGVPDDEGLECNLTVLDPRFYRKLIQGGSIGAAESYMAGHWEVDDLTTLIRIMARDLQSADGIERGAARIKQLFDRLLHRLRANTQSGSRRNIHAHYDLGNDFFASFLDSTMTYSCAVFDGQQATLEQGSTLKYDLICRKLSLGQDDEVLEIGCGWGGFALHAVRNYGCRITATTISKEQYEYAARRVREAGLGDRITLLLQDYRWLPEQTDRLFDKLVSIEMIEAVGHKYLGKYFHVCERLLKPEGRMLLQSIVIADQTYESYRRSVDFTQRYIFPGGLTPSLTALCSAMTRSSDLRVADLQDITSHYATTLLKWRENFLAKREEIRGLGLSESFLRMWEFYFCYCEAGFRERTIGTFQIMLARPRTSVAGPVPQA